MNQQSIMNSLKDKGPEAWREYLRPFEEGEPITGLSMDVIFHHIAPIAKRENDLNWAEVAVRAAELNARISSGAVERENALLQAMRLRSWFILKNGTRPRHFVLDNSIILEWIMGGLTLSLQKAKEKIKTLSQRMAEIKNAKEDERQRLREDLSELRRIKHRLIIAKELTDCGELPRGSVLDQWLELHQQLP